jgi:ubiquinone biosynthesis protein
MEYKVLSGPFNAGQLERDLNSHAAEGWRVAGTGLLHQVILVALAATSGVMAVLMLGLNGGPAITKAVTLYAFFGYCLLVIAAILALRVLVLVFRPDIR